jgi:protoporphyrinogen oxidase
MARISILGAGAMGLAAAYHAAKAGHEVDVFEAGDEPGGMAAHFDFDGLSIERFYHFVCKSDTPTFALLEELGLKNAVIWRNTSMGYATLGGMYRWGDPLSLMRFPKLDLMSKLRYGALMYLASKRERWDELEQQSARDWITRWCGSRVWDILWARLFELKFDRHADHVSAAWIWRRIHRLSRSRASLFQEQLGYIEGGTETLVHALVAAIEQFGGRIHLSSPAKRVLTQKDSKGYEAVQTVVTATRSVPCDHVISTVPVQFVPDLVPTLPEQTKQAYRAIQNSGVICVLLKLARPVSPHFWVNIAEPNLEAAGIIEFSNLRPVDHAVVYVPFYVSHEHPRWR